MAGSIATNSCNCQQLIRVDNPSNLQPMVANTKEDFAKRLNQACGNASPPIPEERGRTAELCRRVKKAGLKVSGESVRKWLAGESIPSMDNIRFIARALGVNTEWLLTGNLTYAARGNELKSQDKAVDEAFDPVIRDVISIMQKLDTEGQSKVLFAARLALDDFERTNRQNSQARAG